MRRVGTYSEPVETYTTGRVSPGASRKALTCEDGGCVGAGAELRCLSLRTSSHAPGLRKRTGGRTWGQLQPGPDGGPSTASHSPQSRMGPTRCVALDRVAGVSRP